MNVGDLINNRFEIIRELGSGSMGKVMVAVDPQTGEEFALKYCISTEDGDLRRFKREVRIMSEQNHESIIRVIAFDLDNTPPYFVMPLAIGNLWHLIQTTKPDQTTMLNIFTSICIGVAALHEAGVFHRDINPNNVLYFEGNRIVVSDLGLARKKIRESQTHNSSKGAYGTAFYDAPEQYVAFENADVRTDVYQLGKTLYALLTGRHPHTVDAKKVSPFLFHIIDKATQTEPDERYQTVAEMQKAITSFIASKDPHANPETILKSKISEAMDDIKGSKDICLTILDILDTKKTDPAGFIKSFDMLPARMLGFMAKDLEASFLPIVALYEKKLFEYHEMEKLDYEYAEVVARKMKRICDETSLMAIKYKALSVALKISVELNRFAAMEIVNEILISIKKDEEAFIIADYLRGNIYELERIYEHVTKHKLHFHLQHVCTELEAEIATRSSNSTSIDNSDLWY